MKVISWQKALVLLLQNRVDVLEFHSIYVHSPSRSFQLPAVIRLRRYIKPFFRLKDRPSRHQIFRRDQQTCQYCMQTLPLKLLTVDHVVPLCRGGTNTWENMVTSCGACNNRKGSSTLAASGMKLARAPVRPDALEERGIVQVSESVPEPWRPYLPLLGAC